MGFVDKGCWQGQLIASYIDRHGMIWYVMIHIRNSTRNMIQKSGEHWLCGIDLVSLVCYCLPARGKLPPTDSSHISHNVTRYFLLSMQARRYRTEHSTSRVSWFFLYSSGAQYFIDWWRRSPALRARLENEVFSFRRSWKPRLHLFWKWLVS